MSKCESCGNAIFDAMWGEYKCNVRQHVVFQPEIFKDCEYYKEGKPTESKSNTDNKS